MSTGDKKKSSSLAKALRLLSYRDRSIKAMKEKLDEKGLSGEEITDVIETLTNEGLLNDERFAKELVASRIRNKNWGPRKISMDLMRKGLPKEITEKVISELGRESVTLAAKRALEKWTVSKGLSLAEGLEAKDFKRAYSHLESRGFNGELIVQLLRYRDDGTRAVE